MALAEDYNGVKRETAIQTLEEMVKSAKAHPEVWARQWEQRAKNIEYVKSLPGFDPVKLKDMIDQQARAEEAMVLARNEP